MRANHRGLAVEPALVIQPNGLKVRHRVAQIGQQLIERIAVVATTTQARRRRRQLLQELGQCIAVIAGQTCQAIVSQQDTQRSLIVHVDKGGRYLLGAGVARCHPPMVADENAPRGFLDDQGTVKARVIDTCRDGSDVALVRVARMGLHAVDGDKLSALVDDVHALWRPDISGCVRIGIIPVAALALPLALVRRMQSRRLTQMALGLANMPGCLLSSLQRALMLAPTVTLNRARKVIGGMAQMADGLLLVMHGGMLGHSGVLLCGVLAGRRKGQRGGNPVKAD